MADNGYIYAVARIRSQELHLLNAQFLESLVSSGSEEAALKMLAEKGWGSEGQNAEEILTGEEQKIWDLIGELVKDLSVFDVFRYENDYHNLKAAIKEACTAGTHPGIYMKGGTIDPSLLETAMAERSFEDIPQEMRAPAEEAMDVLLKTRDGQLCDCIIDRAALTEIRKAGKASKSDLLGLYGELVCATGDIKTAVRGSRTGKDKSFLLEALAPCSTLDVTRLAEAASDSSEALNAYIAATSYSDALDELKKSLSAFECWCDNLLIEKIRPQLHNSFGLDPLAAFILARRMEIKSVRIILTGLRNDMPGNVNRERVRETYV